MRAAPATETAVRAVLDRLAEVYVTRDAAVMRALFAPDPDVVMYTPGADAVVADADDHLVRQIFEQYVCLRRGPGVQPDIGQSIVDDGCQFDGSITLDHDGVRGRRHRH